MDQRVLSTYTLGSQNTFKNSCHCKMVIFMKGTVKWRGNEKFEALTEEGGKIIFGENGIPMKTLLLSVAGCTSIDVVMILQKMREPIEGLEVEISGERRDEHPRIYLPVACKTPSERIGGSGRVNRPVRVRLLATEC